jgi:Uma2 family endonuclease
MAAALLEAPTPAREADAEDLPPVEYYEYVDGIGLERPEMSTKSQLLGFRIARRLDAYGERTGLGFAMTEVLFRLPLERDRRRCPDAAFVPYSVWSKGRDFPDTHGWDALPSLCVEVVSPSDIVVELETKIEEYLEAGVALVWVVHPQHQFIAIHERGRPVRRAYRSEVLDGGDVLPGFTLPLAELFAGAA